MPYSRRPIPPYLARHASESSRTTEAERTSSDSQSSPSSFSEVETITSSRADGDGFDDESSSSSPSAVSSDYHPHLHSHLRDGEDDAVTPRVDPMSSQFSFRHLIAGSYRSGLSNLTCEDAVEEGMRDHEDSHKDGVATPNPDQPDPGERIDTCPDVESSDASAGRKRTLSRPACLRRHTAPVPRSIESTLSDSSSPPAHLVHLNRFPARQFQ